MSDRIREVLGLPEKSQRAASAAEDDFAQSFREAMARLNQKLQPVAAQGSQAIRQPLEAQRTKLIEAFQKTSKRLNSEEQKQGQTDASRIMAAVSAVEGKAADVAADVVAHRQRWLQCEDDFDDAQLKCKELADAGDPKAPALQQVVAGIQSKVNTKEYREACGTFEKFLPKLAKIYEGSQQQAGQQQTGQQQADGRAAGGGTADEFFAELAALEQAVDQLIAENQLSV